MKLLFINEGIFEPYKSFVEREKSSYIYKYTQFMYEFSIFLE